MIRRYGVGDLDELLDVWHEASLMAHPFLTEEFFASERQQVAEVWVPIAETTALHGCAGMRKAVCAARDVASVG